MKALRTMNGELRVDDIPVPEAEGEALVRVLRSGICNTDIEIARGYAGFNGTLGHEFVGIVETSPVNPSLEGKRVVGEINAGCGQCVLCLSGDARHCSNRTVLGIHGRDGAHAEFLILPAINLLEVPVSVSDNAAVFAEPLAAAEGISEQIEIKPDTRVAVVGDGKLGLLCTFTMARRAKGVALFGKHSGKMALANRKGRDIETHYSAASNDFSGAFDVVIEASGSESGFSTALGLVRPRGKLVLKSTFHGETGLDASRIVVNEITVVGSRCGRLAPALELLSRGEIEVEDLISDEISLSKGVAAMHRAAEKGVLKVLLTS